MRRVIRATLFVLFIICLFYIVSGPKNIDPAIVDIIMKILIIVIPCFAYIIVFQRDIDIKECLKLNRLSVKQVLILVLMGFLIQPFAMLINSMTSVFFENKVIEYVKVFDNTPFWLMLISLAVMPALMEEILMRGIVLYDSRSLGLKSAALLNGVLFGVLHRNFTQFFYAVVFGIVFVYVVSITGSLYSTMILHFIINATQVVMQQLFDGKDVMVDYGQISLFEKIRGVGVMTIICIIVLPMITGLFMSLKRRSNPCFK